MRLTTAGGIREMHWHQFAEWAYMIYGTCRITTLAECHMYRITLSVALK
jgi:oxalate decarboxylase